MNVSKSREGAVVPRFAFTSYSVVLGATTVVLCIAGLRAGGTLPDEVHDALHRGARELLEFACAKETVGTRLAGCG